MVSLPISSLWQKKEYRGNAANKLTYLLNQECICEVSDAPLLVFANKQDLKGAKSPVEIAEALHLHQKMDIIV